MFRDSAVHVCSLSELAYPDVRNPEPYLIQQFVRGAHATSVQKNIVSSHACATLNDALNKIAEVVNVDDLNTEVFEVNRVRERVTTGSERRCFNCNRVGHVQRQCRARSQLSPNNQAQRFERTERPRCQLCAQFGHVATACNSVKVVPSKTSAAAFQYQEQTNKNSGARPNNQQRRNTPSPFYRNKATGNPAGISKNANGLSQ